MTPEYYLNSLISAFPDAVSETSSFRGECSVTVKNSSYYAVAVFLKEKMNFDTLSDITAADYFPREPRFVLSAQLFSSAAASRLRLKCVLADGAAAVSLKQLWSGAGWLEREVYDMFGIDFGDGPRRLFMPHDFAGFPLRKDFKKSGTGSGEEK